MHLVLASRNLPDQWAAGTWTSIETIVLIDNHLNGTLPDSWGSIGSWQSISSLHLNNNNFTGKLTEWCNFFLPACFCLPVCLLGTAYAALQWSMASSDQHRELYHGDTLCTDSTRHWP